MARRIGPSRRALEALRREDSPHRYPGGRPATRERICPCSARFTQRLTPGRFGGDWCDACLARIGWREIYDRAAGIGEIPPNLMRYIVASNG
jgi:hypothetical protein